MLYFYTPVFQVSKDLTADPPVAWQVSPGRGSAPIEIADPMPSGRYHWDDGGNGLGQIGVRYVIEVAESEPAQAEWTLKTRAEVDADYPGVF